MIEVSSSLKARWMDLVKQFGVEEALALEVYEAIETRYTEDHRHYHTLQHLASMFTDLDEVTVALDADERTAVEFAVWFHDFVYEPGAKTNESRSGEYARAMLARLGVSEDIVARVTYMIECTASHSHPENDYATQLFLDADMAILGKSPDTYEAYMEGVRREFGRIPRVLYKSGRKRFLKSLLAQDRIFVTDHFHERYECAARKNIAMELHLSA